METFAGPWDRYAVNHLFRRCLFGHKPERLQQALAEGLDTCIRSILEERPVRDYPLAYVAADPVGIGQTWVNAPFDQQVNGTRIVSFQSWWIKQMLAATTIHQKMTLFWHNHFVVESAVVRDPRALYNYYSTLHTHALGNVKLLAEKITLDPAMLNYLNGDSNTNRSPNENYARELFELFSIGKGPQIADGNYSTYTEQDVFAAARVLTGWRVNRLTQEAFFQANLHDDGEKQFSEAFDHQVIQNQGDQEYKVLIAMIFRKKETARFIMRKIYRWFVFHAISEEVEEQVIVPLADQLYEDNYEIKGALEILLSSAHFFEMALRGAIIKNPIDYVLGTAIMGTSLPEALDDSGVQQQYGFWRYLGILASQMQMTISSPPQVAGWEAYYQAPVYYRSWINSATLPLRQQFLQGLFSNRGLRNSGFTLMFNYIPLVQSTSDPEDVRVVVQELSSLFLAQAMTKELEDFLVNALIPGLPEYEWGNQWRVYDSNPQDNNLRMAIEAKLQSFFTVMTNLPEFQLG